MAYFRCASGGGGSAPVLITKNITQNGTYNASADNADGYSQVKVEVSGGGSTLGEKTISTYGVYNASADNLDGYSKVTNVTGLETATASGAVASISDAVAMPCPSVVANIDYTAQGVTGATLTRCGKNLFVDDSSKYTRPYDYYVCPIKLKANTRYRYSARLKAGKTALSGCVVIVVADGDRYTNFVGKQTLVTSAGIANEVTVLTDNTYVSPKCAIYLASGVSFSDIFDTYELQIEEGTVSTTYEPYDGTDYTADFGRTVYGGNYDFVSGVLTEDTDSNGDPISPPNVYNLTGQTITTAQGVNNFYCDTGDTAATYYRLNPTLETVLSDGVISDTSDYRTATFSDISDYSKILVTMKWEGTPMTYSQVINVADIGNEMNITLNNVQITLTKTSIRSTYYSGDFHNITASIYAWCQLPSYVERLCYFVGVQSDSVQIPPATSLDEDTNFSTYLSYDTTTKKFTVLKAFSAMVTGWVYQFQNASSYGTGQFVVNDTAKMNYQVPSTSAGSKDGDTGVFDFAVGDTFWAYQNSGNGWPQQFLKVYLIKNLGISSVIEWDDETT